MGDVMLKMFVPSYKQGNKTLSYLHVLKIQSKRGYRMHRFIVGHSRGVVGKTRTFPVF